MGCICPDCKEWFEVCRNNNPWNQVLFCPLCGHEVDSENDWLWDEKEENKGEVMDINPGYKASIKQLFPSGTNSTMFTECCGTAISDNQRCCPGCGREVIGCDAETTHERHMIRWKTATAGWRR